MTAEPQLPELSDSTFHMLRCVVAVAAADKLIRSQELLFLNNLLIHYRKRATILPSHVDRLQADLKAQQPIDALLARVTDRTDREKLVLFAGLMAQSDGEVHPAEEELVRKIHAHCVPPANDAAPRAPEPAAIPGFDMSAFKKEIRSIVQQDFYKKALATSGVTRPTGPVAVADAFTERDDQRTRQASFALITQDAGRHRPIFQAAPKLPKTDFSPKGLLKLVLAPVVLWLLSTQADMIASIVTYNLTVDLVHWNLSPQTRNTLYKILSSPSWGTAPARFLRDWAGLLLLWRLYALWMSGRLSRLMRSSILPDEQILGKARFHFIYIAHPMLWAALLWGLSFKANMFLAEQTYHLMEYISARDDLDGKFYDTAMRVLASPAWGAFPGHAMRWLAVFIVLYRVVRAWMTEVVVTDSRLLFSQGILRVRTLKTDIFNLRQVDVKQSLLGRMLNYGYISFLTNNWSGKGSEIAVAGIALPPVADPHVFSTLVDRARRLWRKGHVQGQS